MIHETYFALSKNQGRVPTDSPDEPVLDVSEIQGNSLVGFNKDNQAFLFFRIIDPKAAKIWLKGFIPNVATVDETLGFRRLFRAMRGRRGIEPSGLVATWVNIAFTYEGLKKLTSDEAMQAFPSDAFRNGMDARAGLLGDEVDARGNPVDWVVGSGGTHPDLVLIVASDLETSLTERLNELNQDRRIGTPGLADGTSGLELIFEQKAATLPDHLRGHEQFGFKDGISQPGIRGLVTDVQNDYLTPRRIDPTDPLALTHAKPGQPLIWPGQFVFGQRYPHQNEADPVQPGLIVQPMPRWAENGSFVVIRRLKQDVAAFWQFVRTEAERLTQSAGIGSISPEKLASLLVGRWPSGAPIMRTPDADDPDLGGDDLASNHFNFSQPTLSVKLHPPAIDNFPRAPMDSSGARCPFAAHIRKVNPRDDDTEVGGPSHTLPKRVLRRGIPFGSPHPNPLAGDDGVDRGLMFVCYQTSIEDQFEFLTQDWANSDVNPHSFRGATGTGSDTPAGIDPIIGQKQNGNGHSQFTIWRPDGGFEAILIMKRFVKSTGGGYFFSPSISALRDVLST